MQPVRFRDLGPLAWSQSREHLAPRPWPVRVGLQLPVAFLGWCSAGMVRGFVHDQRRTIVHLIPLRAPQRRSTPRPRARAGALSVLAVAAAGCLLLMEWLRLSGLYGIVDAGLAAAGASLLAAFVLAGVEGQFAPPASDWQLGLLVLDGDDWPMEDVLDLVRTQVPWGDTIRLLPTNDEEHEICRRLGAEPARARSRRSRARSRWMIARAPVPTAPVQDQIVASPAAAAPAPYREREQRDTGLPGDRGPGVSDTPRPRWVGSALVWSSGSPPDDSRGVPGDGHAG